MPLRDAGHIQNTEQRHRFQKIIPRSLGSIVRGYKIGVTKWFRTTYCDTQMVWQRNYHEHIIRDEADLERIREYVINNPKNWQTDQFFY